MQGGTSPRGVRNAPSRRAFFAGAIAQVAFVPSVAGAVTELRLRDFGGVADGTLDGRGTDNAAALRRFLTELASGRHRRAVIEPGVYAYEGEVGAVSAAFGDILLSCWGATLVQRSPAVTKGRHYLAIRSVNFSGGLLTIEGLTLAFSRPVGRVGNTDFLWIQGFRGVHLESVAVLSSDNMGVTLDRVVPAGWVAQEYRVERCRFGSAPDPDNLDAYGRIGDTGLWMPNGSKHLSLTDCRFEATGDDAFFWGPVPTATSGAPLVRTSYDITGLQVRNCTTGGTISNANGVVEGRIHRTALWGFAVAAALNGKPGNRSDHARIKLRIEEPGAMQAGEIGRQSIAKGDTHKQALWIYSSGQKYDLDVQVERPAAETLCIQTPSNGALRHVTGRLSIVSNAANHAPIIRRRGSGGSLQNLDLKLDVDELASPLFDWKLSRDAADGAIKIDATVQPPVGALSTIPLYAGRINGVAGGRLQGLQVTMSGVGAGTQARIAVCGAAAVNGVQMATTGGRQRLRLDCS